MFKRTIISLAFIFFLAKPAFASDVFWWQFQSIDTMKYSRDLARQKVKDFSFDATIDQQMQSIAQAGANFVALATPYDEEFLPMLKRWVSAARKNGLSVWFRGNWSGWEGWFNYPKISRQEHLAKTKKFISDNVDLFRDGDIFSSCPECENGGPGDPRLNGGVATHRKFLIDEYQVSRDAFRNIGRNVAANFSPMNGDVAKLVMDKETTRALGGVVVIDHYVNKPEQLAADVREIAEESGGKIVLGEFGAPIPDIHGKMSESEQAEWIKQSLKLLAKIPQLIGINYWVGFGGSTEIWTGSGLPKPAVNVVASFFKPKRVSGLVVNELEKPISNAKIISEEKEIITAEDGKFVLPYLEQEEMITINADGFLEKKLAAGSDDFAKIVLVKEHKNLFFRLAFFLHKFFK